MIEVTSALVAYIGPETIFPVASFIAAAAGFILMAGKRFQLFCIRGCQNLWRGLRGVKECDSQQSQ